MSSIQAVSSISSAYDSAVKQLEAIESGSSSAPASVMTAAQSTTASRSQSTTAASGGSASSSSSSTDSLKYDKRDTNKDGVVSAEEALAYELKHPNEAKQNPSSASQTQTAMKAYQENQKSSRILSLYAYSR